ncbi:MAG TPA: hypothetical protein VHM91_15075, partial [Verrucomicrobiales bacterium]|nr:hypothetical protein [Verrucomicrobiales bacterium]
MSKQPKATNKDATTEKRPALIPPADMVRGVAAILGNRALDIFSNLPAEEPVTPSEKSAVGEFEKAAIAYDRARRWITYKAGTSSESSPPAYDLKRRRIPSRKPGKWPVTLSEALRLYIRVAPRVKGGHNTRMELMAKALKQGGAYYKSESEVDDWIARLNWEGVEEDDFDQLEGYWRTWELREKRAQSRAAAKE